MGRIDDADAYVAIEHNEEKENYLGVAENAGSEDNDTKVYRIPNRVDKVHLKEIAKERKVKTFQAETLIKAIGIVLSKRIYVNVENILDLKILREDKVALKEAENRDVTTTIDHLEDIQGGNLQDRIEEEKDNLCI